ncbi:MAG: GGDEF domain-containing protein [Hyphomicrobiales bacterium]|nr:GGDEF domain-containing protein [Hyphomicrobiales bacterium]
MNLDIHTLFLVTVYVEAILGLLLLFVWAQNLQVRAVAWWGSAHLMRAASIALFGMFGTVSSIISIDLANAILFLAFAVTWTGARVFDGRKPLPLVMVGGSALWLLVAYVPTLGDRYEIRFLIASGIIATYTWLTAYEFWRGRAEPLVSRWPAIFMLFAHGALFLLRTPLAAMLPWPPNNQKFESVWLTVLSFEALMFTISIAFILLAMAKERTEFRHRTDAMVDPLTGVANRRSFLNDAAEVAAGQPPATPIAVLLMDLDHFKSINDRFGHGVGDRVLQVFADSTQETIRAADLFGRLGGEEFAAVLRNVKREEAIALAEQIHRHFIEAAAYVDGYAVSATVSIGIVVSDDARLVGMPELLAQADQALYCAKARGRNRVEIAPANDASGRSMTPAAPLVPTRNAA